MPASKRPVLPPLQTPTSASFPSEIVACASPMPCLSAVIKQEEALNTPITPPVAYTDFLKALTPVLTSPAPNSAVPKSYSSDESSGRDTPTSGPSTSTSFSSGRSDTSKPQSASIPPPSPYTRPQSTYSPNGLKRLRIPTSPAFSPGAVASPRSAGMSARSPFSPADWGLDGSGRQYFFEPSRTGCSRPVSVRSVVTRTVTYKRTPPLDPAPKGKKRKAEHLDMPPPPSSPATARTPTAVI